MTSVLFAAILIQAASMAVVPLGRGPSHCAVLDLRLVTPDSMVALISQPDCGPVRLVSAGSARRSPMGSGYSTVRLFEIPVALENTGDTALRLPISMGVDSSAPIQRGRQINAAYIRSYGGFVDWLWQFHSGREGATSLGPRARSDVRLLKITVNPLTQGIRVWFGIDAHPKPPHEPLPPPGWRPEHPVPLGATVDSFIRAAAFPKLRSSTLAFYDAGHAVRIFTLSYGGPQDCPAGCFYSGAVGLQYGMKIGWLTLDDYDRNDRLRQHIEESMFAVSAEDSYVLSQELADTLTVLYGRYGWLVDRVFLPLALGSPYVPRSRLVGYAEGLYADVNQSLARLLIASPRVQSDVDLLTVLANLPDGGWSYESTRAEARQKLWQMVPDLIANPKTPPRTLFLAAQTLQAYRDTTLMLAMAQHPNVRRNPATLIVLARWMPRLDAKVVASVRAPEPVKALLARYLVESRTISGPVLGWSLLRDPQAGTNEDVLAVLANGSIGGDYEVACAASRRLPEEAFRRLEYPYVALH